MDKILRAYIRGYRIDENGGIISPKGIELKGCVLEGYRIFTIRYGNKILDCKVSRLQALQKYGEKMFEKGVVVRHLNGKSEDDSWQNISIGTHSDNMKDIPPAIRLAKALHATSFTRKHNKTAIKEFHKLNGNSYKKTMKEFNINSKGTLHFILNN